jgi:pumilio homology domain family member 6
LTRLIFGTTHLFAIPICPSVATATMASRSKRKANDGGDGVAASSSKKASLTTPRSALAKKQKYTKGRQVSKAGTGNAKPANTVPLEKEKFAEIVENGKRLWNQLRLKTNTTAQTNELVLELIPMVTGRAHALSLRHDASRVVQAALQFGSVEQRRSIVQELCLPSKSNSNNNSGGWLELCQSQYAHFVVLKVLTYCHSDPECWALILKSFRGHVAKLAVHATASKVMEALFLLLKPNHQPTNAKGKNRKDAGAAPTSDGFLLFLELYGPHVTLFGTNFDTATEEQKVNKGNKRLTLSDHLARMPDKKDIILDFVRNLVNKGMEKQLYGFTYFQELLLEYCQVIPAHEIRAMASTGADMTIHLLSAKAGTHVAALWTAYGTAKERKRILRSLKGYTRSGLLHRQAYLAILRLVQLTDDTVSIHKNLFQELLKPPALEVASVKTQKNGIQAQPASSAATAAESPLLEIALSDTGSKLFLLLLVDETSNSEGYKKLLDPYEHSVLFPNPVVVENGVEIPTSRKDSTIRRQELVQCLREPLIEMCSQHASALLRSIPGSAVLKEVYANLDRPASIVQAVVDVCVAESSDVVTDAADKTTLFEDVIGHRALKNLILVDAKIDDTGSSLSRKLVDQLTSKQWMEIAKTNRGAFVVAAVGQIAALQPQLRKNLVVTELRKRKAKSSSAAAGWEALLKVVSP